MRLRFTRAAERARYYERYIPFVLAILLIPVGLLLIGSSPIPGVFLLILGLLGTGTGIYDLFQTQHALMRNYPLSSRMRYLLEHFRPEIRQYFVENDHDETPFSREQRAVVYRRAKGVEGVRPFGTLRNVYGDGYEWLNHSIATTHLPGHDFRIRIGGPDCRQPYDSSVVNISGMSYGALSPNAIEALNRAARAGVLPIRRARGRSRAITGWAAIWSGRSARVISGAAIPTEVSARRASARRPSTRQSR